MNCKSCNTRIPDGQSSCPACGRTQKRPSFAPASSETRSRPAQPLSETSAPVTSRSRTPSASPERPERTETRRTRPRGAFVADRKEKPAAAPPRDPAPAPAAPPAPAAAPPAPSPFSIDPSELRALLAEQPELLEAGLALFGGDTGQDGAGYRTDVGEIDLLAVDEAGDFVVVVVAGAETGPELIAGILQRVGWVRKHLGKEEQDVRAILLTEPPPEELLYAAAALGGALELKTWQVSLSFDTLAL